MLVFPNCKINLGLHILNKRDDSFHNLETVFYPVPLKDALEIVKSPDTNHSSDTIFINTGLKIEGESSNNLCIKAYQLLKKEFPLLPSVQIQLHKTIPMGAGLGGGSSDGAFTLILLNEKFQLGLSVQQLIYLALQLGSDCPFFILNKPAFATGRGEILEPVALDLRAYKFAIVNPGIHVNTSWAFAQLKINGNGCSERPALKTIMQQPIGTWKDQLTNDFEEPVCKAHPVIANIKQELYNAGAIYASMTGSGSTLYGIFHKEHQPTFSFPEGYFYSII